MKTDVSFLFEFVGEDGFAVGTPVGDRDYYLFEARLSKKIFLNNKQVKL